MRFQLALDFGDVSEVLKTVEQTALLIDIVEIGTPLIIKYGMEPVRAVKAEFPDLTVLADTKIMDAGRYEAKIAFDAGADIVTVMGVTNNETIAGAVAGAKENGGEIMIDMMCVADLSARAVELKKLGARYLCVHTAKDTQAYSNPYNDLIIVHKAVGPSGTAIAGGVNLESVALLREYRPEVVIVGGAVTEQADVKAAAADIRKALGQLE